MMEAKATVIKGGSYGLSPANTERIREAQAEISFKAGQEDVILESKMGTLTVSSLVKKGRQEVVEWLMENNSTPFNSYYGIKILKEEWQAKLKEWEIK